MEEDMEAILFIVLYPIFVGFIIVAGIVLHTLIERIRK
jgi:hypothetical protein